MSVCICVCETVCMRECRLADEVCVHGGGVFIRACVRECAHAHTKLGVTMDSKGAFEVF